jgi:hypothetical protein
VRAWVAQAQADTGDWPGLTSDERAELARLRRENRSLREDAGVLKRATAFFASMPGDPVKVHPFIEAEKAAGHGIQRACRLLEVSRAAFCQRRTGAVCPRRAADAVLCCQRRSPASIRNRRAPADRREFTRSCAATARPAESGG